MTIPDAVKNRLFNYDKWLMLLFSLMPLILISFNGFELRDSISNFAYMKNNQIYYFLIFIGAGMLGHNGAIKKDNYQIVLGLLLAGIGLTPHLDYPILHTRIAALFFLMAMLQMILFSSKKHKNKMIFLSIFIVFGMVGHFVFKWFSLFFAEALSLLPIITRYYFQYKKIKQH